MTLDELGWDERWAQAFQSYAEAGLVPGRVTEVRGWYRVAAEQGELWASVAGKLRHEAAGRGELPAVGDWVALLLDSTRPLDDAHQAASIRAILPRRSKFSRKIAGEKMDEQVVAANLDQIWIVTSLDADFSLRRIERYLTLAWESGASPVIVLTKRDLCPNVEELEAQVLEIAPGVPIHAVSNKTGEGLDELRGYLTKRRTVALLGSSGVGKSSLINQIVGSDLQRTSEVREYDSKGRHTTTHRQLIQLESGALVVDTPGMREVQLWDAESGLTETFPDIEELALQCKFTDCLHQKEPGCAVRAAIASGELDPKRLESYHKLEIELSRLARKGDPRAQADARRQDRAFHKHIRKTLKEKGRK